MSAGHPDSGDNFSRGQRRSRDLMVLAMEEMVLPRSDGVCGDGVDEV